jgi:hypothetical protein
VLDRGRPRLVVVLVVLRAERLEQEVIRDESTWRLEVVGDEGHLGIVARVTSRRPEILDEPDDDAVGAADVAVPVDVLVLRHLAYEFGVVGRAGGR